ncbi:hypothetical protein UFOVP147_36 [uncultured Caudovirales phage]|uniref:Uncharacterized protein n=1 Tax=uncultured Caudovirales phage TaxID=2100421 RepID=A0A6J7W1R0_9CAUD|nr:hypothetical protein UFOVP147_36 [uncultured Caudovirales phage]
MTIRRADDNAYTLLSNGTATGSAVAVRGGEYIFMAEGTVAGATIALQVQSPNGTWSPVLIFAGSAVSFTALPNAQTGIDLPAGNVRVAITGTPTGVYAYLVGLG